MNKNKYPAILLILFLIVIINITPFGSFVAIKLSDGLEKLGDRAVDKNKELASQYYSLAGFLYENDQIRLKLIKNYYLAGNTKGLDLVYSRIAGDTTRYSVINFILLQGDIESARNILDKKEAVSEKVYIENIISLTNNETNKAIDTNHCSGSEKCNKLVEKITRSSRNSNIDTIFLSKAKLLYNEGFLILAQNKLKGNNLEKNRDYQYLLARTSQDIDITTARGSINNAIKIDPFHKELYGFALTMKDYEQHKEIFRKLSTNDINYFSVH